jgi:hypothetical protein
MAKLQPYSQTKLRVTLHKRKIQHSNWLRALNMVSRLLDKDLGLRQIKLWFSLHGNILEGKSIGLHEKKELQGKFMVWRTKVQGRVQGYSFLQLLFFFHCFFNPCSNFVKNGKNVMDWEHCWEHKSSPFWTNFRVDTVGFVNLDKVIPRRNAF